MSKYALLVGVSEYRAEDFKPLPSATADVEAMRRVLQHSEMGGFPADQIVVLTNPTKNEVESAIFNLFAGKQSDDLLLFYFSGHGVKDDTGKLYFTVPDTQKFQEMLMGHTAIAASMLHDQMDRSASEYQVLVLDCCFSGAIAKGMTIKDDGGVDVRSQLGGRGRAIFTASSSTQYSFQQDDLPLSVYTQFFVEGIEKGAADLDGDGQISADELHRYVFKEVKTLVPAMTPQFYPVEQGYQIYLAKSPNLAPKYRRKVERQGQKRVSKMESNHFPLQFTLPSVSPSVITQTSIAPTVNQSFTLDLSNLDPDNKVQLEMVAIPGGSFWMGSPDEVGRDDERPRHQVEVASFWMSKCPITQAQYQAIIGKNPSGFKGSNRPVECVSWWDGVAFCEKLGEKSNLTFRLPSEAEWEYACRAGTETLFYFGRAISMNQANQANKHTTEVKFFPPNAFSLYDMHGNVWEWCADHWHKDYNGAPSSGNAWLGRRNNQFRVARGGSWADLEEGCRSAFRSKVRQDNQGKYIGFRIVYSS